MNVFDLFAKITLDTSDYENGLSNASSNSESFGSKLSNGVGKAAKATAAAVSAATTAVVAIGGSSVKAGAEFDASMSQVAATMDMTNEELNNTEVTVGDFTGSLRDFALEMGSRTSFSATQAADALNYMALAGYDAKTSVSMLPNVLNLAAAGGIELASASDMVTDAASALGLNIDETSELVDKMAMASSKSNTSVAQLGDAILTVGGTAKMLSGGTTELSTALGILADNGTKGAEGGTKLRNILLSLGAPTDAGADALSKLGVSVYDANGNMRPLKDTIGDLNNAMSKMTDAEKTDIINTIFNKADLKDVNALLATSGKRWDELSGYIDDASGSAEKMSHTQLDNLAGDITIFQSALEGAKISISDGLTPSLRELVKFGTKEMSKLGDAIKKGGISAGIDALSEIMTDGLNMIVEYIPKVVEAGTKLLEGLVMGIIDNIDKVIEVCLEIVETVGQAIIDNLPLLLEAGMEIIVTLAGYLANNLPELIPTIVDTMIFIVNMLIDNIDKLVDASIAIIVALAEGLINALPKLIEKAPEIVLKLTDAIVTNAPKLLQAGLQLIVTLAGALITYLPKLIAKAPEIITQLVNKFISLVSKFIEVGEKIVNQIKDSITSKWESVKNSVSTWIGQLLDKFLGSLSGFFDVGKSIVEGIWNGISAGWDWLVGKVKDLANSLYQGAKDALDINSPSKRFAELGMYSAQGFGVGWDSAFDGVQKSIISDLDFDVNTPKTAGSRNVNGAIVQNITINQATSTPDELARAIRLESRYGLMRGVAIG